MSEQDTPQAGAEQGAQSNLAIQKIYTKDVSFETPNTPGIFRHEEWSPAVNLQLASSSNNLDGDAYEVVLSITVTAKLGEDTAYLCEVQQAGVFSIAGFSDQDKHYMLGAYCPNILFPYAREAISDLVTRGGFPQMLLAPVNFDALYSQQMQQATQGGEEQTVQ